MEVGCCDAVHGGDSVVGVEEAADRAGVGCCKLPG